jgi:hypothetical protein
LGAPLDSVVDLETGVVAWVATLLVGAYLLRIAEKDSFNKILAPLCTILKQSHTEDSAISLGKNAANSGDEKV